MTELTFENTKVGMLFRHKLDKGYFFTIISKDEDMYHAQVNYEKPRPGNYDIDIVYGTGNEDYILEVIIEGFEL